MLRYKGQAAASKGGGAVQKGVRASEYDKTHGVKRRITTAGSVDTDRTLRVSLKIEWKIRRVVGQKGGSVRRVVASLRGNMHHQWVGWGRGVVNGRGIFHLLHSITRSVCLLLSNFTKHKSANQKMFAYKIELAYISTINHVIMVHLTLLVCTYWT